MSLSRSLSPSIATPVCSRLFSTAAATLAAVPTSSIPQAKAHLVPSTGVYPRGFKAAAVHAGIKKKPGVLDLVLVASDPSHPCTAAAVFTTNAFQAAPVLVDKEIVATHPTRVQGVLTNAGCANACTGDQGLSNARESSKLAAAALQTSNPALVMSTGVIGQHLDMSKMRAGIQSVASQLAEGHDAWMKAAMGIMTTDTFPKLRSGEFVLPSGKRYRMAGMCKGAGMIHPNMATMLSTVYTDLPIVPSLLRSAVRSAADWSFNAISIDGDTSTNDTFAVLANGAAATGENWGVQEEGADYSAFRDQLTEFSAEMAKLVVRDGEGATKFVTIDVEGAENFSSAHHIASTIATSPLVKTALFGRDANWGRVVCAVGYSGIAVDPARVNLWFSSPYPGGKALHIFKDGAPYQIDEEVAAEILEKEDVNIKVKVGEGEGIARMYTCDFSYDYVKINADYRS
ncbi:Arginine biosynthesis bifunctional protein ArgJ beta chain [Gonapodya prolifera JEL478]|uniref:Arginine biosynthesis bifunctional protein ArgJ, mitochondrial n=1 Tax=Gonapodya prolifera (strain JEL478) TaxID=1344416 RepID=A0A139B043_GONPJ|nr:Arginine biosynthesis bifunctional protein ArgJ beta chain [Gonapodya prolifera JEL478]|eukprot:KXS22361.1 Arginine biosynthesis bifunctional protein ArgJ beta chain [Gonapodya prolifera JEL478]